MSEGLLIKPDGIPQDVWDQSEPAVRGCFVMLMKRIEDLERRLGMNSGNSSMPPSNDGPGQQPVKPPKGKSGKRRRGQHGHAKRIRPVIPAKDCDRVESHRPSVCSDCGTKLSGDNANPVRHQVIEIPAGRPIVTG
jgi:transposase